ncbi:hypothetical protein [Natrinema limicola]|uniref:hypothetical protein n=1 Tax=Natrinema limicola TaxID=370323 RepID=UPI000B2C03EF|nr:hypothetical protein [Natrinema limicola]
MPADTDGKRRRGWRLERRDWQRSRTHPDCCHELPVAPYGGRGDTETDSDGLLP